MPVKIPPEYEKAWNYLCSRKTPATVKQVRKVLLISETHARRALDYFVFAEIADRFDKNSVRFYKVKE